MVSKIGNPFGSSIAHKRFVEWDENKGEEAIKENMRKGKHFMTQFLEDNPDLTDGKHLLNVIGVDLDDVRSYDRLFWVLPQTSKEEKIFELLSQKFNDNKDFLIGKFGGFPLGDTTIKTQPLVNIQDKYYSFSTSLAFRNIFEITTNLLEKADSIYYEQNFKNNTYHNSKDNYIERKTKDVFENFLPKVNFYHSLDYKILMEDGKEKLTELDILGIGESHIYIIEVKAGELNSKHKRGALKGLKDRLKETINEGTFQCYRAEKYIEETKNPTFTYIEENSRKTLVIDKTNNKEIIKISVMFEHFASIAVNLKYLIENGVLSPDYKWTWIVSLYDLMVFRDLIDSEEDFVEYISHRINLYERNDVEFQDEIDILGFFLEGKFPINIETTVDKVNIISYRDDIDDYYTKTGVGILSKKPQRK
ncbi:hypothetical protein [Chryseobacterium balustinum]|uniref:hypothetical protein n=1 Tax=Chryseobacterium balustinum TaxID=246 RepID=UPI003CEC983B